jgi:hypothetical protein
MKPFVVRTAGRSIARKEKAPVFRLSENRRIRFHARVNAAFVAKRASHAKMCKSPDLRSEKGSPFSRPCLPSHGKPQ